MDPKSRRLTLHRYQDHPTDRALCKLVKVHPEVDERCAACGRNEEEADTMVWLVEGAPTCGHCLKRGSGESFAVVGWCEECQGRQAFDEDWVCSCGNADTQNTIEWHHAGMPLPVEEVPDGEAR